MYGFSIQLKVPFDTAVTQVTQAQVHAIGKEVLALLHRVSASLKA